MGHDFRPEFAVKAIIEAIGQKVPVIALTATATPKVSRISEKSGMADATLFKASFNRPTFIMKSGQDQEYCQGYHKIH